MLRFRQIRSLQKFPSVHANIHNHFSLDRRLVNRQTYDERSSAALAEWGVPVTVVLTDVAQTGNDILGMFLGLDITTTGMSRSCASVPPMWIWTVMVRRTKPVVLTDPS